MVPSTARRVLVAFAVIGVFAASACAPPHPRGEAALSMGAGSHTVTTGGRSRSYTVRRPAAGRAPVPLLVVLHGAGGNGGDVERDTGFTARLAERAVVIYPNGLYNTWNAGGCCLRSAAEGVDDLGFVSSLVRAAVHDGVADPTRLYVAGFSNGGMLAYDLLCNSPVPLTGVEVVGGALVSPCPNSPRGAEVVVLHDRGDVMVRPGGYDGVLPTGQHLHYPPLLETVETLRQRLGCTGAPALVTRNGVEARHWTTCPAGGSLTVDLLSGVGHTWPGNRSISSHSGDPLDATTGGILLLHI